MGFLGDFVVPRTPHALHFSRKHFRHSLKKHVVGFKVVCKNQLAFFSGTSSLNQSTFLDLNRHFLANVPGKAPHIKKKYIYTHDTLVNFGV